LPKLKVGFPKSGVDFAPSAAGTSFKDSESVPLNEKEAPVVGGSAPCNVVPNGLVDGTTGAVLAAEVDVTDGVELTFPKSGCCGAGAFTEGGAPNVRPKEGFGACAKLLPNNEPSFGLRGPLRGPATGLVTGPPNNIGSLGAAPEPSPASGSLIPKVTLDGSLGSPLLSLPPATFSVSFVGARRCNDGSLRSPNFT
jgi:hypothetical protein